MDRIQHLNYGWLITPALIVAAALFVIDWARGRSR